MAKNNRKTRAPSAKVGKARYRFANAAEAAAVEDRLANRKGSVVGYTRTGRVIEVLATQGTILEKLAEREGVEVSVIGPRGRPKGDTAPAAKAKPKAKPARAADKAPKKKKVTIDKRAPAEVLDGIPGKKLTNKKPMRRLMANKLTKPSQRKGAKTESEGATTRPIWILNIVSSNLEKAWYNCVAKRLTILFKSGKRYRYEDVSLKEFMAFTTAESQGKWFGAHIKDVKEFKQIK